ncbi:DUF3718 domain-containing protein [Corallincola platygyrae]|uniref:DUF3718 domain-containing protein n=1 Tax=Corallincola platygyrae TaxID=1193278 RepID=A0ABW4XSV5_9GAMM
MNIKTTTLSAVAAASLALSALIPTQAVANDAFAQSLCGYVAADDPGRLRKKLKENKLRLRKVYDDILCDGSSMLKFAIEKGSVGAGEFITKKLPKKSLTKSGPDGWVILEWAESKGHADSAIVTAIRSRIAG